MIVLRAAALLSDGCEESSVHCDLGIECETQSARILFLLMAWGVSALVGEPMWSGKESWYIEKKRQAYVLKSKQV